MTTRSDIWYPDGSVVLLAGTTQFRVHWSMLAQHSSVFREMQDLPQPPAYSESSPSIGSADPTVDGCPVVEIHDAPADVAYMLTALYDPTFLLQPTIPLAALAALLRLGRKYDFRKMQQAAVDRLARENPTTLAEYDALLVDGQYRPKGIDVCGGLRFEMLALAAEYEVRTALPCAYWRVLQLPREWLLDGVPRSNGTTVQLSPSYLRTCLLAHEKLTRMQFQDGYSLAWLHDHTTQPDCASPEQCLRARGAMLRSYTSRHLTASMLLSPSKWSTALQMLCARCRERSEASMNAGRERAWAELPSYFDLSPWAQLSNEV